MGNRYGNPPESDDEQDSDSTEYQDTLPPSEEINDDAQQGGEEPSESSSGTSGVIGSVGGLVGSVGPGGTPEPETPEPETPEPETPESKEESDEGEERQEDDDVDLEEPENEEESFVFGDIVIDREESEDVSVNPNAEMKANATDYVVVNLPDIPIVQWENDEEETLASRNPGYPLTDEVVVVVERETLDNDIPQWTEREEEITLEELEENDTEYLAFPSLRLILIEESPDRNP